MVRLHRKEHMRKMATHKSVPPISSCRRMPMLLRSNPVIKMAARRWRYRSFRNRKSKAQGWRNLVWMPKMKLWRQSATKKPSQAAQKSQNEDKNKEHRTWHSSIWAIRVRTEAISSTNKSFRTSKVKYLTDLIKNTNIKMVQAQAEIDKSSPLWFPKRWSR